MPGNHLLLDQLILTMSHTMKICNLLQSTQDVTYPTLASSQKTVYQDLFPTDRDTCPRRQEKIPETTATQGLPFVPATASTDSRSIRPRTQPISCIQRNNDSHEFVPRQHKQSIRVRGPPVKAACLACRKRKAIRGGVRRQGCGSLIRDAITHDEECCKLETSEMR